MKPILPRLCIRSSPIAGCCPWAASIAPHQRRRLHAASPLIAAARRRSSDHQPVSLADLDVLAGAKPPPTAVESATPAAGFLLTSGLRIADGSGVLLVAGEAFRWRPWVGAAVPAETQPEEEAGPGQCVNGKGQFEVGEAAFGLLAVLWPRPDLLIIGAGATIRPLAPSTRRHLASIGLRVEVLDTGNAAAQYSMLATERGHGQVAAALMPLGGGGRREAGRSG